MAKHDIITLGASSGGVESVRRITAGLPADLPATVLLVIHSEQGGPQILSDILGSAGPLPAVIPEDGDPLRQGCVYVAPADVHLLVRKGFVRLSRSPRENRARPAVDPLFRSAADAYGARVVGVVLSGSLDDGAAGLLSIKAHGGVTVVQDPKEAVFPGMPEAALRTGAVDHCLPLREIPELLVQLAKHEVGGPSPDEAGGPTDAPTASEIACPICHGVLWEYRTSATMECRIGHTFSPESLLAAQADDLESALWGAVRALEECAATERRVAGKLTTQLGRRHAESAVAKQQQARVIRRMLLGSPTEAVFEERDVELACGGGRSQPPGGAPQP